MTTDRYRSKPVINPEKLDFSDFHDLMHNLWECRGLPGGRRRHIKYRWDFQIKPWLYAETLCRLGWHTQTGQAWRGDMTWKCCVWCHKRLSEKQQG